MAGGGMGGFAGRSGRGNSRETKTAGTHRLGRLQDGGELVRTHKGEGTGLGLELYRG